MTEKPTVIPFRAEPWWARPFRLTLVALLGVYAVFILGVLFFVTIDRAFKAAVPVDALSADDRASIALEHADRILNLLEVVLGIVALLLPLALGVIVYIFQQNRRTIEQLTQTAERAETNAARSQQRVEEYREEAKSTDKRVNDALNKIEIAEQLDRQRDELSKQREEENLQRDLARDEAARNLEAQIIAQKREVEDVSMTARDLLSQSRDAQDKLKKVDQFLEVRRHSALCTSEDVLEATTAVLTLMQIAQYPAPDDDDDSMSHDPLRAERDMLLRREALRALVSVRESANVPQEIGERLLAMLQSMMDGQDHKVLRLEAQRTFSYLKVRIPEPTPLKPASRRKVSST
jgi:hypothetical protein